MDANKMAAITAAIQAYMESETKDTQKRFGQRLSPWKMAARRETMSRRSLTERPNPLRQRLRRFSII